eukprot:TRINITY_DN9844_c0_g1_i1.p1 TRINITY_DN9844_c0_g1~~TRINITY_DN9844_c0_g1_i1.p1  ORF type:complete len:800 (+),score=142.02 TRINITY_DN9844_c0_g1_i1:1806-4205(+)
MVIVTKGDLRSEPLQREKLVRRIKALIYGLDEAVSVDAVVDKIIDGACEGISTKKLDELAAEQACYMATQHPDYSLLGGRIAVTALHKQTKASFSAVISDLYHYVNPRNGQPAPLIAKNIYDIVQRHTVELDAAIVHNRDFRYDFFGFKTLERSYLLRQDTEAGTRKVIERPQHLLMRVAVGIHGEDIPRALETYDLMSQCYFTHASPTMFNAGTPRPQLSSCFLVAMKEDSIEGIYNTLRECALISKSAGGIGLHIHNIRAQGSYIRGTNGVSNGLVPMLRVFNDTARYVDQGGGKRKGAFAIYLEPWHADVFDFLSLRKNHGKEEQRARDLFYALWIPDLFMRRVEENGNWSLFCPNEAPGLADVWGEEFEALYHRYETEKRARKTVRAQELWFAILESQVETGTPYMLYKDSANRKSNHQNLGTIKCSNLCTEIMEYTSADETAVCNLASLSLPAFVKTVNGKTFFDHEELKRVTEVVAFNLNRIIDANFYPCPEAETSNKRHRPVGIGIQGLADAFLLLRLPFTSDEAQRLNEDIFETIYYGALSASNALAERYGHYPSYPGCPVSKGVLQFDMWGVTPKSGRWDWAALKAKIAQHGVRNSLLIAPMPTASTSQILGNNECFEPFTSNVYVRRVLAGEFPVVNKYLVKDLIKLNLWNEETRNVIIAHNGSIQNVLGIPQEIKELYRTVWEVKQKQIIDMAVTRSAYIDQSSSLNLFLEQPTSAQLTSMHFYSWKKGLKTGMYYLRTKAATDAIKFTVDQEKLKEHQAKVAEAEEEPVTYCTKEMRESGTCASCSS